ncbi:hypothetical protein E4U55_004594 [Claviceps digitariae]|nr:hypothetical protein E4U55_004594 [Claviceps digitariae]
MASVKAHSGVFSHPAGKLSKSRSRTVVKPILRKLHSHTDRGSSLDLDRGWDDQPSPGFAAGPDFGTYDSDASYHYPAPAVSSMRSGRDSVGYAAGALAMTATTEGARGKYSHVRSISGNSHASSIATTTSGRNGGSFVHPFQQTPQTSTPPILSYANSRASLDNGFIPGYSPTITEDDDVDDIDPYSSFHSTISTHSAHSAYSSSTTPRPALYQSAYFQHPNHRRPSFVGHGTSSLSDGNPTTRISATRSTLAQARPLGTASVNQSRSELDSSALSSLVADSPLSSTGPLGTTAATALSTSQTNVTSSSASPMSPLRHSLDMGGFRLRSRSELDTSTHQEHVLEARRKFEAKERAKEEKYAREQHRKRERAESKETHRLEKTQSRLRNGSTGNDSVSSGTRSSGTDIRITSSSRKHGAQVDDAREKIDFATHGYESTHDRQTTPIRADDVHFFSSKRIRTAQTAKSAKHKTAGVWTAFVLWLRTRLLKLGRR